MWYTIITNEGKRNRCLEQAFTVALCTFLRRISDDPDEWADERRILVTDP